MGPPSCDGSKIRASRNRRCRALRPSSGGGRESSVLTQGETLWMHILGINAYHGNASAAIVSDGKLVAAVEEERFNRVKYAAGFPAAAIRYCLKEAGLTIAEIDHVGVPRNPYARLATKVFYALRMPSFARERAKALTKFAAIPEALAEACGVDEKSLSAKFHRVEH